MINLVIMIIVAVLMILAVGYMIRAKKNGAACIGCSCAGSCSGSCANHGQTKDYKEEQTTK